MLSACGKGEGGNGVSPGTTYTIGTTLTGLTGGVLELQNIGSDDLVLTKNGAARFSNPITANGSYAVTIKRAPAGQVCSINNSIGVGVMANSTNAQIVCGTAISGLAVGGLAKTRRNESAWFPMERV